MSYIVCNVIDLGETYTGATLNAQLYDSSNSTVGSAITTGFYERAGAKGIYTFTLTVPDAHQGWCDIYVQGASATVLATLPINPAELENANVRISDLNNLSISNVEFALSDYGVAVTGDLTDFIGTGGANLTAIGDTRLAHLDADVSSLATPANVTSAQTAITSAISALNNLSQAQAQTAASAALTAYGAATATNVSDTQTAITTAVGALNDLSATDAAAAIMVYAMMGARQFQDVVMDLWAVWVGNSDANDATAPTVVNYQNVVTGGQVTHILTPTTRTLD